MEEKRVNSNLILRKVRIIYRNFSGAASKYNRAGNRNFSIIIPSREDADKYANDGWHIRCREPRNDGDEPMFYMPVAVNLDSYNPPKIYMGCDKTNMVEVNEDTIAELDHADIINCDIVVRPYNWNVNGQTGVKAYLKLMYAYIEEDPFANDDFAEQEFPVEEAEEDLPF